jgi:Fic family protein
MNPPYSITSKILDHVSKISIILGQIAGLTLPEISIELRKENRIRTIYNSLMIEGNQLTKEQVTAVINGKPVVGKNKDIQEVKNAINAYNDIQKYKFDSFKSFLGAHKTMMERLVDDAGKIRSSNVGIFKDDKVAHMAPKYTLVPQLMTDLFNFIKNDTDINMLILSSIAHYEIEFIHPFKDGNGRMGRLWQTVLLKEWHPLFEYLPIESLIRQNQETYYSVLGECDKIGDSTLFIEFMLEIILSTLTEYFEQLNPKPLNSTDRLLVYKKHNINKCFSRKDYMKYFKNISSATASRDLNKGIQENLLKKLGDKNTTTYQFHTPM